MMVSQSMRYLLVLTLAAVSTIRIEAIELFSSIFEKSNEGFTFATNTFSTATLDGYSFGRYATVNKGGLEVKLGGIDSRVVNEISGGWIKDFTIPQSSSVIVDVLLTTNVSSAYEFDEYNRVLCSIDGKLVGSADGLTYLKEIYGAGNGTRNGIGDPPLIAPNTWVKIRLGVLTAGTHRLILGAYNNKKTFFNEESQMTFSNVNVQYFPVFVPTRPVTKAPVKTPVKSPTKVIAPVRPPLRPPNVTPVSVSPPTTSTNLYTIRISTGSSTNYVAPNGDVWLADEKFRTSGQMFANCPLNIDGTTLDDLYCKERFYNKWMEPNTKFQYTIPVPRRGKYTVKLHFAETFYTGSQQRIFDILVDGMKVIKGLDIYAKAGFATALIVPITAQVTATTSIVIELVGKVENPKICAIEVMEVTSAVVPFPTAAPVVKPVEILINCGGNSFDELFTDRTWEADQYYIGGLPYSDGSTDIMNTVDDQLYQTERYGEFRYEVPLQYNGKYAVKLHFAELYWPNIGQRLFGIVVERNATTAISNFDIVARGNGKRHQAVTVEFKDVIVIDKFLSIVLSNSIPKVDNPKLSGIEIHRM